LVWLYWFLLFDDPETQKKLETIQEIKDPVRGCKRTRVFDGTFDQVFHDNLYIYGKALDANVVFFQSKEPLETSILTEALHALSKRHPLLRMKFEWEESKEFGKTIRYLAEMEQFGSNELIYSESNQKRSEWVTML
jgi:hypothetical protein